MNQKFQVILQQCVTNTQQVHLTQLLIIQDQEIEDLVDAGGSSNPPSITESIWTPQKFREAPTRSNLWKKGSDIH